MQLEKTSKKGMLVLSELSASVVELLLRVAESYLVGVTSPTVVHEAENTEENKNLDESNELNEDEPNVEDEFTEQEASNKDTATPALLVHSLVKEIVKNIEDITDIFVSSANKISQVGKEALHNINPEQQSEVDMHTKEIDSKALARPESSMAKGQWEM